MTFVSIPEAIEELKKGNFLIVADSEHRENEGDLVLAAEKVTPEKINFMIKNAGGLICVPMLKKRLVELQIPLMIDDKKNTEITRCKFTLSVDYMHGTTTGISASDRAKTIMALINPKSKPDDFARPGHIFPLRAEDDGVLKREGHTEAAVDVCRLAGLYPAGVICEILREDGEAARVPELKKYAEKYKLKMITIDELKRYIQEN